MFSQDILYNLLNKVNFRVVVKVVKRILNVFSFFKILVHLVWKQQSSWNLGEVLYKLKGIDFRKWMQETL